MKNSVISSTTSQKTSSRSTWRPRARRTSIDGTRTSRGSTLSRTRRPCSYPTSTSTSAKASAEMWVLSRYSYWQLDLLRKLSLPFRGGNRQPHRDGQTLRGRGAVVSALQSLLECQGLQPHRQQDRGCPSLQHLHQRGGTNQNS